MTTTSNVSSKVIPFSEPNEAQERIAAIDAKYRKPPKVFMTEESFDTKARRKLTPRLAELANMLEYARPDRSETEEHFISTYIDTLPHCYADGFGNRIVRVGKVSPTVCWTSHTDTVAWNEGTQAIDINRQGHFCLDFNSSGSCLGADCTAGVWLMRRMILAGKPGLYIFHRAEESGGEGSTWIAENTPGLVGGIKALISLDRKGYSSVITEQTTGKTASRSFALSIAKQLGGAFKPDPTGTFTDSAFYSHLVPECSNLSIGYHNCHSTNETLDYRFTDALLIKLLALDYEALEIVREPKARAAYRGFGYASFYGQEWDSYLDGANDPYDDDEEENTDNGPKSSGLYIDSYLASMVRRNPEATALLFQQLDLTEDDLLEAIAEYDDYQMRSAGL